MTNPCIYDDYECDPHYCTHAHCSFSSDCRLKCNECGEIISSCYYEINNRIYCEDCMKENFEKIWIEEE